MASTAFTTAGSTVSLSASVPATYDAAGYAALTYTSIAELTDIGQYGKTYNVIKHMPIAQRIVVKRKGSFDIGQLVLKMAKSGTSDAGQTLLQAAADSDSSYSFKIVLQNGVINYVTGQTSKFVTMLGGVDTITSLEVTVDLDNPIVIV